MSDTVRVKMDEVVNSIAMIAEYKATAELRIAALAACLDKYEKQLLDVQSQLIDRNTELFTERECGNNTAARLREVEEAHRLEQMMRRGAEAELDKIKNPPPIKCPNDCKGGYTHSSGDGWDEWDECSCCNPDGKNDTGMVTQKRLAEYEDKIAADAAAFNESYSKVLIRDLDKAEARATAAEQELMEEQAMCKRFAAQLIEHAGQRDTAINALQNLVTALGKTNWSSWQSTARFQPELEAAEDTLAALCGSERG